MLAAVLGGHIALLPPRPLSEGLTSAVFLVPCPVCQIAHQLVESSSSPTSTCSLPRRTPGTRAFAGGVDEEEVAERGGYVGEEDHPKPIAARWVSSVPMHLVSNGDRSQPHHALIFAGGALNRPGIRGGSIPCRMTEWMGTTEGVPPESSGSELLDFQRHCRGRASLMRHQGPAGVRSRRVFEQGIRK